MRDAGYTLEFMVRFISCVSDAILAANDEVLKVMTRYKKTVEGEDNGLLLDTSTPEAKGKADGKDSRTLILTTNTLTAFTKKIKELAKNTSHLT